MIKSELSEGISLLYEEMEQLCASMRTKKYFDSKKSDFPQFHASEKRKFVSCVLINVPFAVQPLKIGKLFLPFSSCSLLSSSQICFSCCLNFLQNYFLNRLEMKIIFVIFLCYFILECFPSESYKKKKISRKSGKA